MRIVSCGNRISAIKKNGRGSGGVSGLQNTRSMNVFFVPGKALARV
jgi:hypothetical protein